MLRKSRHGKGKWVVEKVKRKMETKKTADDKIPTCAGWLRGEAPRYSIAMLQ
jgi:hypothetical protein